jgi:hypothetical protein
MDQKENYGIACFRPNPARCPSIRTTEQASSPVAVGGRHCRTGCSGWMRVGGKVHRPIPHLSLTRERHSHHQHHHCHHCHHCHHHRLQRCWHRQNRHPSATRTTRVPAFRSTAATWTAKAEAATDPNTCGDRSTWWVTTFTASTRTAMGSAASHPSSTRARKGKTESSQMAVRRSTAQSH